MAKIQIIRKSKIGWVLTEDTVTAFDNWQATIYHLYESSTKQPIELLKQEVRKSKPDELNSWVDVLDLASKRGLRGYATRIREEWFES